MPYLPENARLWLERAKIDYIGPFVKAWASFNAWYREASGQGKDSEGFRYVKQQANPVRSAIMPLLQPVQPDRHGNLLPDSEAAQKIQASYPGPARVPRYLSYRGYQERRARANFVSRSIPWTCRQYPADLGLQADAVLG